MTYEKAIETATVARNNMLATGWIVPEVSIAKAAEAMVKSSTVMKAMDAAIVVFTSYAKKARL